MSTPIDNTNTQADPDNNLMDVPCLLGNEKLKPVKTDDGIIWKKVEPEKNCEENKNCFGCGPSVFGTPPPTTTGLFGATPTGLFGATPTGLFGATPTTNLCGTPFGLPANKNVFGNLATAPPLNNNLFPNFTGNPSGNTFFGIPNGRIPAFIFDGSVVKIIEPNKNIKYHEHSDLMIELRELKRELRILKREKEEYLEKIEYLKKFEEKTKKLIEQNDKLEAENDCLRDEILILRSK